MKWEHRASVEWMQARQDWLTASDIKKLLPVTATGRPRKIGPEQYLEVFAASYDPIDEDTCVSYGPAARGHVMESYAVDMFNKIQTTYYFHWDDVVLVSEHKSLLAFSPDALDIPQPKYVEDATLYGWDLKQLPTSMLEIKSYGMVNHLKSATTNKAELPERWQLATAMAAFDSIETAELFFFNPDTPSFRATYTREDLEKEIDIVKEIEKGYKEWLHDWTDITKKHFKLEKINVKGPNEEEIYERHLRDNRLNP